VKEMNDSGADRRGGVRLRFSGSTDEPVSETVQYGSQKSAERSAGESHRRSPQLQIMLVAGPRNQLYLEHEVAGFWRPPAVYGRAQHSRSRWHSAYGPDAEAVPSQ
jgi:hypothetical protein